MKRTLIFALIFIVAAVVAVYIAYPKVLRSLDPGVVAGESQSVFFDNEETEVPKSGDLCGGTGGNGQIVSIENDTIIIKRKDQSNLTVNLKDQAKIETSTGPASISDLKINDKITLVGDMNSDGTFTAETIVVCM